jgi:hypothetical protein
MGCFLQSRRQGDRVAESRKRTPNEIINQAINENRFGENLLYLFSCTTFFVGVGVLVTGAYQGQRRGCQRLVLSGDASGAPYPGAEHGDQAARDPLDQLQDRGGSGEDPSGILRRDDPIEAHPQEGAAEIMINVFRPHTYPEVAGTIAEGLRSGDLLLERDETQEDLASFAWFALSFLHPAKISYTAPAALAAGGPAVPGHAKIAMEMGAEEFESLPPEVRDHLLRQLNELQSRGVQVELTDSEGQPLPLEQGIGLAATR